MRRVIGRHAPGARPREPRTPPVPAIRVSVRRQALIAEAAGSAEQHAIRLLRRALDGAVLALRSYQYGNSAPDLATEIADFGAEALAATEAHA